MKLWFLRDPYSVEGLRYRASKLPNCPYKLLLELTATQLEKKIITRDEAKKAVEYFRSGNRELVSVGLKILNLSEEQIEKALKMLRGSWAENE